MRYDEHIMNAVLNIYKPQGMTPLQALDVLREKYPEYRSEKMTYAGRLDPMAEGVLIVLVGDAVHKKEEYLHLDKTYEAAVMVGFGTDTHDLLGMATEHGKEGIAERRVRAEVKNMTGVFEYAFPAYSSKPINGKPLFQWAREGRLEEIEMPKRVMRVYNAELLGIHSMTVKEIGNNIKERIAKVRGDFRQEEISDRWGAILADIDKDSTYVVAQIRIHCASGTYVRTLAHELGKRLGTDAVLLRLVRATVGEHSIGGAIQL